MPCLKILTNVAVAKGEAKPLLAEASKTVTAGLGKPERYVMVALEDSRPMLFGGSDAPTAYLELKSIGLPQAKTAALSASLCGLMERLLKIPQDRVYIEFANAEGAWWGWNGQTF